MGEKDLTEKILEDYNDVFADIMNALVFKGKDVVHPDSLRNSSVHSQYKASDQKLHEMNWSVMSQNIGWMEMSGSPYVAWKIRLKSKSLCHFECSVMTELHTGASCWTGRIKSSQ
mgnify:FL=1